jgi:hypothetical protein
VRGKKNGLARTHAYTPAYLCKREEARVKTNVSESSGGMRGGGKTVEYPVEYVWQGS